MTDLFYIKYLDRYPDVRKYFEGIELEHQAVVLKMALTTIQQYYEHHYPAAEQYLKVLGYRHRMQQVPKHLYPDWCDSMLDTLEQFHGSDWNEALEAEWRAAIKLATDVMHRAYDEAALHDHET